MITVLKFIKKYVSNAWILKTGDKLVTKESEMPKKQVKATDNSGEKQIFDKNKKSSAEEQSVHENDRVGSILYNERVKKGLDLVEISQILCIRRSYLDAIEKGNYSQLPVMPYSSGFVNAYAKYLGLNNVRITQLFREEINVDKKSVRPIVNEDIPAEASIPGKFYVLSGIIAAVLVALLWNAFTPAASENTQTEDDKAIEMQNETASSPAGEIEYFSEDETVDNKAKEIVDSENLPVSVTEQITVSEESYVEPAVVKTAVEQVSAKSEKKTEAKKEAEKTENQPAATKNKAEVNKPQDVAKGNILIEITKEDTWLEVKDKNKVYISKILHVGESYRLPNVKGLILSSGKYDGVNVYVDGKLTPMINPNKKMNIDVDSVLNANH